MREAPVEIWRSSNTPPVIWSFEDADGAPVPLAGSAFDLRVQWDGGELIASSAGEAPALTVDPAAGSVTWNYSLADSERMPHGRGARYELRRSIAGTVRPWAGGPVTVKSWLLR